MFCHDTDSRLPLKALPGIEGNIEFRDIHFHYPSRSDIKIFNGFNLTVPAGQVTAVVGPSGSGKSTVCSLLLRFYDPVAGKAVCSVQKLQVQILWELWTKGHPENQWSGLMKRVGCLGEGSFTWTKEEQGLSCGLERSTVQHAGLLISTAQHPGLLHCGY